MKFLILLLVIPALLLGACVMAPPIAVQAGPSPDILTSLDIPLYLKHNCVFLTESIALYVDNVQAFLEQRDDHVERTRVSVYPPDGLWKRDRYLRNYYGREDGAWGPREVKVVWYGDEQGAPAYATMRLRQAGRRGKLHGLDDKAHGAGLKALNKQL